MLCPDSATASLRSSNVGFLTSPNWVIDEPVLIPACHAGEPESTRHTTAGGRGTPWSRYTMMKQIPPRITFMITPAEIIIIRWPTVLFLYDLGYSSPSSASLPSPTMDTYPPRGNAPIMYWVSPRLKLHPGSAGPKPMLKVFT